MKKAIDWLTDPRPTTKPKPEGKGSQAAFCKEIGVNDRTMVEWKAMPKFRAAWDKRCHELNVNPGRVQDIINTLHEKAVEGDVKSAKLYLEYVERISPPRVIVESPDKKINEYSDAEIVKMLQGFLGADVAAVENVTPIRKEG